MMSSRGSTRRLLLAALLAAAMLTNHFVSRPLWSRMYPPLLFPADSGGIGGSGGMANAAPAVGDGPADPHQHRLPPLGGDYDALAVLGVTTGPTTAAKADAADAASADAASSSASPLAFLAAAVQQTLGFRGLETHRPRTVGVAADAVVACAAQRQTCVRGDARELRPPTSSASTPAPGNSDGRTDQSNDVADADAGGGGGGVLLWHVLAESRDCDEAGRLWTAAAATARHFVSVRGRSFDGAAVLARAGYHRYYERWDRHRCHYTTAMLLRAMRDFDDNDNDDDDTTSNRRRRSNEQQPPHPNAAPTGHSTNLPPRSPHRLEAYVVLQLRPVESSYSTALLPKGAAANSPRYNRKVHPRKAPTITAFDGIYEEMRGCALLAPPPTTTTTTSSGAAATGTSTTIGTTLPLYTALALRDCVDPALFRHRQAAIVQCHVMAVAGNSSRRVSNDEECLYELQQRVAASIALAEARLNHNNNNNATAPLAAGGSAANG